MPWPSSTLPVSMVTVPLALMRSQPSRRRLPFKLPGNTAAAAGACAMAGSSGLKEKATVSEVRFRNARRVG